MYLISLLAACLSYLQAGFVTSPYYGERELMYVFQPGVKVLVNAPADADFNPKRPTRLLLYALPNGNTTAWTKGKLPARGDDWHFQIQHIGAQTRFLRRVDRDYNYVTVYLEAEGRSWGAWRNRVASGGRVILALVDSLTRLFVDYRPELLVCSHSGGGNFMFGLLDACERLPREVKGLVFIDSNYNWNDQRYGGKVAAWLRESDDHRLFVACYDDANALLNGKPFISREGGTWHRSELMQACLMEHLPGLGWKRSETDTDIRWSARKGKVQFYWRKNPERKIYHTVLVERNGLIHGALLGTKREERGYRFMGEHAYDAFRQDSLLLPAPFLVGPRAGDAIGGREFVRRVEGLSAVERDSAFVKEMMRGNVPDFLRRSVMLTDLLQDAEGRWHRVTLEVMPDFLSVGNDSDFLRLPLLPLTAQRVADLFGAVLPTRKLSDLIHRHAAQKLVPQPLTPDASMVTLPVFARHHELIQDSLLKRGARLGTLVAGHKKDIVMTNRLAVAPGRLYIYGWHDPDGHAIQPLSGAHGAGYVDYSHGARLVRDEVLVDGHICSLSRLLADPVMYRLFSDEEGPMAQTDDRSVER